MISCNRLVVNTSAKIIRGDPMDLAYQLRLLRSESGYTQQQVADGVGMDMRAYQRYELGTREPAFKYLVSLADFFDVSLDYLVGRTDNPDSHKN